MNQKLGRRKRQGAKKGGPFQDLVGELVKAFHKQADVKVGEWIEGPDGKRELDVHIRGARPERFYLLVECKDYTYSSRPTPVGIGDVDAFESKRRDLNADHSVIVSNSGFTQPALLKAARTGIGAIAVLKEGDRRAKAKILQTFYLRKLRLAQPIRVEYTFDGGVVPQRAQNMEGGVARYEGHLIDTWLLMQALHFQVGHPWTTDAIRTNFRFREPVRVAYHDETWTLTEIAVRFQWQTQWLRQTVELDAGLGIYDFIHPKLLLAPAATNKLVVRDLDFDLAEPCDAPSRDVYRLHNIGKNEFSMQFCLAVGANPIEPVTKDSPLYKIVIEQDLRDVWVGDIPGGS